MRSAPEAEYLGWLRLLLDRFQREYPVGKAPAQGAAATAAAGTTQAPGSAKAPEVPADASAHPVPPSSPPPKAGLPPAAAEAEARAFVSSVGLLPFSVLGARLRLDGTVDASAGPDPSTLPGVVIVDPAGLHHIQPPGGPKGAGGASGAIYKW